jgi:hypothetical protein
MANRYEIFILKVDPAADSMISYSMKFQCRIVSEECRALEWNDFTIGDVIYSPRLPLENADALILFYDPNEELLRFKGPKLWFTIQPASECS